MERSSKQLILANSPRTGGMRMREIIFDLAFLALGLTLGLPLLEHLEVITTV
jgi:hypothetical protein